MQVPSLQPSPSCRGEVPMLHFAFSELTFFLWGSETAAWRTCLLQREPVGFSSSVLYFTWGIKIRTKKKKKRNPPNVVLSWGAVISMYGWCDHIPEWAFPSPITPPHSKRGEKNLLNALQCHRVWENSCLEGNIPSRAPECSSQSFEHSCCPCAPAKLNPFLFKMQILPRCSRFYFVL